MIIWVLYHTMGTGTIPYGNALRQDHVSSRGPSSSLSPVFCSAPILVQPKLACHGLRLSAVLSVVDTTWLSFMLFVTSPLAADDCPTMLTIFSTWTSLSRGLARASAN